jgi:hypothetical protein
MEVSTSQTTLRELPVGTRLLLRTSKDWRSAVISRTGETDVALRVCCSSGRTYWTKRGSETTVILEQNIFRLETLTEEDWRSNFARFEVRW